MSASGMEFCLLSCSASLRSCCTCNLPGEDGCVTELDTSCEDDDHFGIGSEDASGDFGSDIVREL